MKKYSIETKEKIVKSIVEEKLSYREVEKKYKVPRNTAFNWVCKYKERGSYDVLKPQHLKKKKQIIRNNMQSKKNSKPFSKKQQEKK